MERDGLGARVVREAGGFDHPSFGKQPIRVFLGEHVSEGHAKALVPEAGPSACCRICAGSGALRGSRELDLPNRYVDEVGGWRDLACECLRPFES